MNSHSHRLIFNPSRGCLMAVAETSRSCGKSGASNATRRRTKRTSCGRSFPGITQKRMGDGFYEQRLINEQIAQLTGYARLANYASDEQQYQALMSSSAAHEPCTRMSHQAQSQNNTPSTQPDQNVAALINTHKIITQPEISTHAKRLQQCSYQTP